MLCALGAELIRQCGVATRNRDLVRDTAKDLPEQETKVRDAMIAEVARTTKQTYSRAFVAWVKHRAQCVDCRAVYGRDDVVQFALV